MQEIRVASPPPKPLMIYDGDCGFCRRWIDRWRAGGAGNIDYIPSQDESVARQFPEISRENLDHAVHLVMPDGSVCAGAEAVFRALAGDGQDRWLLWLYKKLPLFTFLADIVYQEVATHRVFISKIDRMVFGESSRLPAFVWVRFVFLRGLALIYLVAFVSLATQIQGLAGSHGVNPARRLIRAVKVEMTQGHIGLDKYRIFPTLGWWSDSDSSLDWQCRAGIVLSVLLLFGIAPAPALFLLWLIYLSLSSVTEPFLNFQWDLLLLETGFLAIFFAPLQWRERPSRQPPPSRLVVWLLRWLIFRLMLESGSVKLMSGDHLWWSLDALKVHFQTQPLPTWIGWEAHQLPAWALRAGVFLMFVVELGLPAFIFAGRRPRQAAAAGFVALQVVILLTGNYTFFNALTILLCLPLLDDDALCFLRRKKAAANEPPTLRPGLRWRWPVTALLSIIVVLTTSIPLLNCLGAGPARPGLSRGLYMALEPSRSFNGYGLFAVMTPTRPEIIIEGSDDGIAWLPYGFRWKPGDLRRRPGFVAPFQPRLDWQLWFAALEPPQKNPWFFGLEYRLLQNSPEVTALLADNPFPKAPPRFIRALLCEYSFTDRPTRRATGQWWQRKLLGVYVPPLTLDQFKQAGVTDFE